MFKNLVNPDSPIMSFLGHLADVMLLNILWLLTSLPIVTIGASTTALYYCTLAFAEDRSPRLIETYFRQFRSNLKQGTITGIILLLAGSVLAVDGYVLYHLKNQAAVWVLLYAVWILMMIVFCMIVIYIFPLMARFENTIPMMIRNSLVLAIRFLICTILVAAIHAAMIWIAVSIFTPILLFGEGLCALLSSYLLKNIIHFCEKPEDFRNLKDLKKEADHKKKKKKAHED
jgi:uncharacterized membrane protein YesL